jgi:hypothetical protein
VTDKKIRSNNEANSTREHDNAEKGAATKPKNMEDNPAGIR